MSLPAHFERNWEFVFDDNATIFHDKLSGESLTRQNSQGLRRETLVDDILNYRIGVGRVRRKRCPRNTIGVINTKWLSESMSYCRMLNPSCGKNLNLHIPPVSAEKVIISIIVIVYGWISCNNCIRFVPLPFRFF